MNHIVSYSGGIGSWGAAKRVIERHGTENTILLFADAMWEDNDTYRFLINSSAKFFRVSPFCTVLLRAKALLLKLPDLLTPETIQKRKNLLAAIRKFAIGAIPQLTWIADGRTPWEVMEDEGVIGNSRLDVCSRVLKRELMDRWIADNFTPETCRVYVGIDWTEEHRIKRLAPRKLPWVYEAPLCEPPYRAKWQMLEDCRQSGVEPPIAYSKGASHNNCRQECVKAGQAAWALKLRTDRPGYLMRERWEQKMRERVGDHSILKERKGEVTKTLTLLQLRERIEKGEQYDTLDFGGCGCALDEPTE